MKTSAGKVMKVQVLDNRRHKIRHYLVSVPLASPRSAGGRATRSYWAVEPTSPGQGEVHLVKDVWRIEIPGVREEGLIYDEMEEGGVVNICDLEIFGDVSDCGLTARSVEVRSKYGLYKIPT